MIDPLHGHESCERILVAIGDASMLFRGGCKHHPHPAPIRFVLIQCSSHTEAAQLAKWLLAAEMGGISISTMPGSK